MHTLAICYIQPNSLVSRHIETYKTLLEKCLKFAVCIHFFFVDCTLYSQTQISDNNSNVSWPHILLEIGELHKNPPFSFAALENSENYVGSSKILISKQVLKRGILK